MIDRRTFISGAASAGVATYTLHQVALAAADTERRLIVIFQRGGQDGLHVLPPHGDPHYAGLRPNTAIPSPGESEGALAIDSTFGLHPALVTLHQAYVKKELAIFPAVASRYRERSHFDGQNLLENGSGKAFGATDGFLNRALGGLPKGKGPAGFTVGAAVPLMLLGEARVQSWAPSTLPSVDDDFLQRLLVSYRDDPAFAATLEEAMRSPPPEMNLSRRDARRVNRGRDPQRAAHAVAESLRKSDGARIALLEMHGWDTHFAMNARMNKQLENLDLTLATLRSGLESVWKQTLIVTVSEFGRTAAENGSRGTDHGTAGTTFVWGGAVNGGRIRGEWPGLAPGALYEGRDLFPANSTEAVFRSILTDHLKLGTRFVNKTVLPGTGKIPPIRDLMS